MIGLRQVLFDKVPVFFYSGLGPCPVTGLV